VTCKNVVGQGDSLNVNVTVANTGQYTETFNVTVYSMNSSSIEADKADEWGYSGNILNPQAAVDEDWTTYAYGAGYIFENFTVPSPSAGGTISANWTYKIEAIECIPSIWYWNYSQNDWSLLCSVIGPSAVIIPNDGLTGEKLEIRTLLLTNFGSGIMYRTNYYEGKVTWTVGNIIADFANVALSSQSSVVIAFSWNTAGFDKGNYTLSAFAEPVPGETNTTDNNCIGNWVFVSMVGDLTNYGLWPFVPDGKVDGSDLIVCSRCYGSNPTSPPPLKWDPNCDITNDNKIDGSDLIIVAHAYGTKDP
jgi:hypothetical protein